MTTAARSGPPRPGRLTARTRSWLAVIGGLAGMIATYLIFVRTAAGQRADAAIAPSGGMATASRALAAYDRHIVPAEALLLLGVVLIGTRRGRWWRGLLCAVMPLAVAVEAQALQAVLRRPTFGVAANAHNSFPSGHVALAAATVVAVLLVVPGAWRWPVGLVGAVFVLGVTVATIAAEWHRFSDGLASTLLAVAAGGLVVLAAPDRPAPAEPERLAAREGEELRV